MKRIFDVSVSKDTVALALLNTYSTLVVKTGCCTAIFDPVKIKLKREDKIDLVIITHEHYDHFEQDLVVDLQRRKGAHVLTTPFVAQMFGEVENKVLPLQVGDSFGLGDIVFHAEYAKHPANQPLSFVICTDAGNIYHPNDSGPFPEMGRIKKRFGPELMVYTASSLGDLKETAEMIKPKTILAYEDDRLKDMRVAGMEIRTLSHGQVYIHNRSQ